MTWFDNCLPGPIVNIPDINTPTKYTYTYYKYFTLPQIETPKAIPSKIPHRCPVCTGRGHMPYNFYQDIKTIVTTDPVKCRSCKSTGIVWEVQDN